MGKGLLDEIVEEILGWFFSKREITRGKKFATAIIMFFCMSFAVYSFKEAVYTPVRDWVTNVITSYTGSDITGGIILLMLSSIIIVFYFKKRLPYT